jgi:hypothetical protein
MKYYATAPNLVGDSEGFPVGAAVRWNPYGIGEVIVQYFDGSSDSVYFSELTFPNGRDEAYDYLNAREQ